MSDLPDGWILTPLENCGEWGSGGTPTRTNPLFYKNGAIPWLIIKDLNDGIVTKAATCITKEGLNNSSAKILPVNTLLVAMYGSIGKLGITGIECATNQAIAYCKPHSEVALLKYLFYALMNSKSALLAQGQGGAQQNINQGILKAYNIPLAPLPEQKRIAEKLDSLLARVDSCQTHLERVPQILKRFRQSVLAAATSGRLTEDWREGRAVNGEWESCTIGDVLSDIKYGTAKKSIYELKNGIPVLRIPNIKDGKIDATDLKFSHFDKKEMESLSLKTDDLLLIRSNGSVDLVGKVAIVDSKFEGFMYAGYLIRLRFDTTKVNPHYISYYLSSPAIRGHIELTARSTSGVNNINSEEVKAISLELPSLEEQAEIVRRVERLFAYAERLEARYTSASAHVGRLSPSLLGKAFRGELVGQE